MLLEKINFVDLKKQYASIKDEMDSAVRDVIDKTRFIMGENISRFQEEFSGFCQVKHSVGTSSGTSALQIALTACGIKNGDEIIVPVNTFIATAEAVTLAGAKVKFADVDDKTYNIDIEKTKELINPKTKAIIPVHLYGQPADMKPILELAEEHDIKVIGDACQAHASEYNGKGIATFGDASCFSFFPGKNLGAYGDAGAIATNDCEISEKAAMILNHGRKKGDKYIHTVEGSNQRLDEIQAAVLRVKLRYLDDWTKKRIAHAKLYNELIEGATTPFEASYSKHVYHLYVIRTKKRDGLQKHLNDNGIFTGIHYPVPLHLQPAYGYLKKVEGSFPVAERLSKEILSLPMFPELTREEIERVAECTNDFLKNEN
ncbi:DegT/DnrJ/EryC1/StrS family aminotransferase [Candidatus Woesearchaeota archaeon]|nr:DegT/DnrJ/EryC1/StrS family aminotransferase [Candidatus Woesearchaeota archaeon]